LRPIEEMLRAGRSSEVGADFNLKFLNRRQNLPRNGAFLLTKNSEII